jgi:hypothetical protein
MADGAETNRGKVVAIVLGVLLLGGLVGGAVVLLVTDDDGKSASTTTSTRVTATTATLAPTAPPTTPTPAEPPCTNSAILAALQASDSTIISADGFQCGSSWAGTSYSNANFSSAALLQAQNGTWVVVDRAQYCDDPSIPADVHTFCTVS